jgi:hypothetical protein
LILGAAPDGKSAPAGEGNVDVLLQISAAPGALETDMTGLYGWFLQTDDVTRNAELTLSSKAGAGAMGAADVINVVVTQALAVANLAVAYATYRRALPSAPPVVVYVESGRAVVLPDDPSEARRRLVEAVQDAEESAAGPETGEIH